MEWIPHVLIALAAMLGTLLVVYGSFGGPGLDHPICVACRRDVRQRAWLSPMVCACDAALDQPGSVRTRGRQRRPKTAVVGVLLWCAAFALAAETARLAATGRTWLSYVPQRIIIEQMVLGQRWAIEATPFVIDADALSPEEALDVLLAFPLSIDAWDMREQLQARWWTTMPRIEEAYARGASLMVDTVAPDADNPIIRLQLVPSVVGGWFGRVERVSVEGLDLEWKFTHLEGRGPRLQTGRMTFAGRAGIVLMWPRELDRSRTYTIDIDLEILNSESSFALLNHRSMNDISPPTDPPIRTAGVRRRVHIELPPTRRPPP